MRTMSLVVSFIVFLKIWQGKYERPIDIVDDVVAIKPAHLSFMTLF